MFLSWFLYRLILQHRDDFDKLALVLRHAHPTGSPTYFFTVSRARAVHCKLTNVPDLSHSEFIETVRISSFHEQKTSRTFVRTIFVEESIIPRESTIFTAN